MLDPKLNKINTFQSEERRKYLRSPPEYLTIWSRAALLTQYPRTPGKALVPVTLDTWTMLPLLVMR